MLYGSRHRYTSMPQNRRSHQLGEGHEDTAKMSMGLHPSRLVLGGYSLGAFMPDNYHPHQLGEGQDTFAEMPYNKRPSRLVLESRHDCAVMPMEDRSQGKGHGIIAEMPRNKRPSPPVYGPTHARRNAVRLTPTS